MNRKTGLGLAAAAVLVAAGVAFAAPALAGNGPGPGSDDRPAGAGHMMEQGQLEQGQLEQGPMMEQGQMMGERGTGPGDGACWLTGDEPAGELTAEQEGTLAALAEQYKLAGDLYAAFDEQYGARVFDRLATADSRQLSALTTLLERYGVADPTDGLAAGEFTGPQVQASYDQLLADGSASLAAALAVGQGLEQTQQTQLDAALDGLTAPDVTSVYEHLLGASEHHLTALENAG
jgi:hypothetical protein